MAWDDRDYYRGGGGGSYLSSPGAILQYAMPVGSLFGARIQIHFWLFVAIVFGSIRILQTTSAVWVPIYAALFVLAALVHEFGHRTAAHLVGGSHDEFVLWPAGGMIPVSVPPRPWALFVGSVGGIAANLVVAVACDSAVWMLEKVWAPISLNPLQALFGTTPLFIDGVSPAATAIFMFMSLNMAVLFAAILPYYWFDGAPLGESFLWKWIGRQKAVMVVCWGGMILAVPMALLMLAGTNLMGVFFWGLLFMSAYGKLQETRANPYGGYEEALAEQLASRGTPRAKRASPLKRWANERKVGGREKLQRQVDEILEKVSRHGMHSLSDAEKKTLERASRELRDH